MKVTNNTQGPVFKNGAPSAAFTDLNLGERLDSCSVVGTGSVQNTRKKWQRPKPCWCSGYWFPHRVKSGACDHNPDVMTSAKIIANRAGIKGDELLDYIASVAFDNPGIPSSECPF